MSPADVKAIADRHGVRLLLRFGSSVTGLLHAHSDVDLAVLFERMPETLGALADHRRYLDMERAYVDRAATERRLERAIGRMIDISREGVRRARRRATGCARLSRAHQ